MRLSDSYQIEVSGAGAGLDVLARLQPRAWAGQALRHWQLVVDPAGRPWRHETDRFGNALSRLAIHQDRLRLKITSIAELSLDLSIATAAPPVAVAETGAGALTRPDDALADYACAVTRGCAGDPERRMAALCTAVHKDMTYDPQATTAATTAAEAFQLRAGVCQDFAQVVLAAARTLGLPVFYIGGYKLATEAGRRGRVVAAVPHAWVGLALGDARARAFDPSDPRPDRRRIAVACGRDHGDVEPLQVRGAGARFMRFCAQAQAEML